MAERSSSRAAEARYGVIDGFAQCLIDDREPAKVRHTLTDRLARRIYGLARGHPDANDANRLADDSWHELLFGVTPSAATHEYYNIVSAVP